MALTRIQALETALRAAGIPITGLSDNSEPGGLPVGLTINYAAGATAEQIAAGEQMKETFDYRPRRDLTRSQIVAGITSLTTAQQNAILRHLLAHVIRNNSAEVIAILTETGLPLAVDEVIP